ncbi:MAG: DUF3857 domain-containing protein, partial [Planctomycetota bacterium]
TQTFEYLYNCEDAEIDFARTILSDGTLMHLSDNALEVGATFARQPDYNNLRKVRFSLKEVKEGSVIDFRYHIDRKPSQIFYPLFIREYLQSTEPILQKKVIVFAPNDIELSISQNNFGDNITYIKEIDDNQTIYCFEVINSPRFETESNMPPFADVLPNVTIAAKQSLVKEDESNPNAKEILKNIGWEEIGREFSKILSRNLVNDEFLKSEIESVVEGKTTSLKKASALYRFVTQQITNLDIVPSQSSYYVHRPSHILTRRQGNSLDKAFLLYAMLKLAGFDVQYLLCAERSSGSFLRESPCISLLTSPLLLLKIESDIFYLAPFSNNTQFGYIPPNLQGAAALLISEQTPEIVEIPVLQASKEIIKSNTTVTLNEDGSIKAKCVQSAKGQKACGMRELGNLKPIELKQHFEKEISQIDPNATLVSYKTSDLKDLNIPVVIEYEYEISDYALKAGKKLMAFRLPDLYYSASSINKWERNLPLFWSNNSMQSNTITLVIPENYKVRYLPESIQSYTGGVPYSYYRADFKYNSNTIVFNDEYVRESVYESPSSYKTLLDTIKTAARMSNQWIILEAVK